MAAKSEAADAGSDQALFDFDPPSVALGVGAQQSILVRATSAAALTGSTVAIRFDPAVVTPVVVRPILGNGSGTADAVVQKDHIVIQFPSAEELGGTRALAEITLRGVAPGHSTLAFEPTDISGAAVLSTPSVVDVQ